MCGRLNVIDSPEVKDLCESVGISFDFPPVINAFPTAQIPFIFEQDGSRQIKSAIWWLLLKKTPQGFQPNSDWKTFNAVAKRMKTSRLYGKSFKTSRCIIPVSGYFEWMVKESKRHPYYIRAANKALAFAGLYKTWQLEDRLIYSCTVITLEGHPKLAHIHKKSLPLMIQPDNYDAWLDPNLKDTSDFEKLFTPKLTCNFTASPMDPRMNTAGFQGSECLNPIGDAQLIPAD